MRNDKLTENNLNKHELHADSCEPKRVSDSSYLQAQLLIAMPGLNDSHFKQSVTLICQHTDAGCLGLTINKPASSSVFEVLKQLIDDPKEETLTSSDNENIERSKSVKVLHGGPVKTEQGFIIHDGSQQWENTIRISEELSVTLSKDILIDIATGKGPEKYLFTLGCASWVEGQVDSEFLSNSWLNCPLDPYLIFDMPFEKRWQGAADILGVNMKTISLVSGHD